MQITFTVNPREAETLLRFLRTVLDEDVKKILSSWQEVRRYDKASEKLRVALRKKVDLPHLCLLLRHGNLLHQQDDPEFLTSCVLAMLGGIEWQPKKANRLISGNLRRADRQEMRNPQVITTELRLKPRS